VWIVAGHTDMTKGFDGLAALVQTALAADPFCDHVFVFCGRRANQTTFSIPIAGCRHRVSMAPAAR